jgi:lauroyl/myristoyl acyltransferase
MVESRPDDTRARFGLALEYERKEQREEVNVQRREYRGRADDQGSAYGRLARAQLKLGTVEEAKIAYARGLEATIRAHPADWLWIHNKWKYGREVDD